MNWTRVAFVAILALMPLLAESQVNLTQAATFVCATQGNYTSMSFSIVRNEDGIQTSLLLDKDFWITGHRIVVNATSCQFSGNGSTSNPFKVTVKIDRYTGDVTVVDGDGNDLTSVCPNVTHESDDAVYNVAFKTAQHTAYDTQHDIVYNATCNSTAALNQEQRVNFLAGDVVTTQLTSTYGANCSLVDCNSRQSPPNHMHNLGASVRIICYLEFDDTSPATKTVMDIRSVTYEQSDLPGIGVQTLVENRCAVNNSMPVVIPYANAAGVAFTFGETDAMANKSTNAFETGCFELRTFTRTTNGPTRVAFNLNFETDCINNVLEKDLRVCANYTTCSTDRRKRDTFEDDQETQSVQFDITIEGEAEELTNNEQQTEQPDQERQSDSEMACFQRTTFAALLSIVGVLLILLLVCGVLLFLRVRRDRDGRQKVGHQNKAYN